MSQTLIKRRPFPLPIRQTFGKVLAERTNAPRAFLVKVEAPSLPPTAVKKRDVQAKIFGAIPLCGSPCFGPLQTRFLEDSSRISWKISEDQKTHNKTLHTHFAIFIFCS